MSLYLVRVAKSQDLVGIFNADSIEDFLIAVDECTDPDGCEYKELPVGGLFWSSPAIKIPVPGADNDNEPNEGGPRIPWTDVVMSDSWWNSFYSDEEGWISVTAAIKAGDLSELEDENENEDEDSEPEPPPKPKLRIVKTNKN